MSSRLFRHIPSLPRAWRLRAVSVCAVAALPVVALPALAGTGHHARSADVPACNPADTTYDPVGNVVQNPGFEEGTTSDGSPVSWQVTTAGDPDWDVDSNDPNSGCLSFDGFTYAANDEVYVSQELPALSAPGTYTATFYLKREALQAYARPRQSSTAHADRSGVAAGGIVVRIDGRTARLVASTRAAARDSGTVTPAGYTEETVTATQDGTVSDPSVSFTLYGENTSSYVDDVSVVRDSDVTPVTTPTATPTTTPTPTDTSSPTAPSGPGSPAPAVTPTSPAPSPTTAPAAAFRVLERLRSRYPGHLHIHLRTVAAQPHAEVRFYAVTAGGGSQQIGTALLGRRGTVGVTLPGVSQQTYSVYAVVNGTRSATKTIVVR